MIDLCHRNAMQPEKRLQQQKSKQKSIYKEREKFIERRMAHIGDACGKIINSVSVYISYKIHKNNQF